MRPNPLQKRAFIKCCLIMILALMPVLISNSCAPKTPLAGLNDIDGLSPKAAADYYFLVYQDLQREGKKDEAVAVLQTLTDLAPSPQMYLELANLYWGLNMREKTTEVLEKGLKEFPEDQKLTFYLANAYQLRRYYDKAEATLRGYLDKHPEDQAAVQELTAILIEAESYDEALALLSKTPDDASSAAMLYYRSKAYSGLGDRTRAIASLKKALAKDPNLMAGWAELGYLQEIDKDYKSAVETYKRMLDLGEEGDEVWLRLIKLYLKLKNPEKALAILDQAPQERGFIFEAISAFIDEGYSKEASTLLDRMADESPDNPDMLFYRAVLAYEGEKNLQKAYDLLAQAPKDHSHYDKSLTFRIQLALEMDKPKLALELIAEGQKAYPDKKEFWNLEAAVYDRMGNTLLASQVLQKAAERWPDDPDTLYRYGVALEKLHRRDESVEVMEKIVAMAPDHADALNFLGYTLAEKGKDLDRAFKLIRKALEQSPDNPYFLDSLAWAYHIKGEKKLAWEEIRRCVAGNVEDPIIWEHYGDIAASVGEKKEAAKGYRKALELGPQDEQAVKDKLDAL